METPHANTAPTATSGRIGRLLAALYGVIADPRNGHWFGLLGAVATDPRWTPADP